VGVERAVTRWYARRQLLQYTIVALEARLEQFQLEAQVSTERNEIEQQLLDAQLHLRQLGSCPKPMMG
jgi:hypothetical protein